MDAEKKLMPLDPSATNIFLSIDSVCIGKSAFCPVLKGNMKIQSEAKK